MPHIHTGPGQVDFVVNVYIVYRDKVLLRFHEKHHMWLSVGGHVELDEAPEDAAIREVQEEVGLAVKLWSGNRVQFMNGFADEQYRELIPPLLMNIHKIDENHRHLSLAYFATAETDMVTEPDTYEKSGGCIWLTREELQAHPDIDQATKYYAAKALEVLAS
ncbi:MAG: NUDIX domain-containing protein [Patescibacteria group bacterium]